MAATAFEWARASWGNAEPGVSRDARTGRRRRGQNLQLRHSLRAYSCQVTSEVTVSWVGLASFVLASRVDGPPCESYFFAIACTLHSVRQRYGPWHLFLTVPSGRAASASSFVGSAMSKAPPEAADFAYSPPTKSPLNTPASIIFSPHLRITRSP